ncbi:MAG: leucine-rich repeat domain-containing protein [Bacteroidetes bacterium]|nr:leucine-rich repeat domain-containing protein [Bacteroidota bacterium]
MNKILLKLICAFTLALGLNTTTKAQLVYIPDSIFRVYLHQNFGSCMVGDYIDSNCPAVLNTKILKINNRGISDLTGVAVFVNDTLLECYGNALTTLPILPPSLTSLNCISNQLTNLSNLPPSLNKLICYNNQLTSISNLPSSLTEFYCDNNQLTSISNLPSSLIRFSCDNNQLTTLPILPPPLINLYCQNNLLTSLPNLPNTLDYLYCENNQLTSLPALPSTLTRLACSANQLTGLPSLPVNIKILNCFNNQLISLPGLVNCDVRILNCSNNLLTTLPTLSGNLEYLTCNNNPLTFIPQLPPSLLGLSCSKTQITSLPGLANLRVLDCHSNQLTSIPSLPPYMTYLECGNNLLTSLPNMPTSIVNLYCDNNMIDSLPPMPQSLRYIDCSHNSLTSLPYFYYSIDSIDCSYNQITSLPFSIYTYFKKLDCSNNLITSVPEFNSGLSTFYCQNNPITCLNKLKGIKTLDISGTLINCLLDYGVVTNCNPPISNFPICDAFNTNGCDLFWNIGGTSFIDSDSNCIIGINEPNYSNQKISLYKNGVFDQFTYTSFAGKYDFNTISYDTYKTEIDTMGKPFKINCPLAGFYLDTITPIDSMKYDRNFGVKCKGVDLAVTNINSNNIRPASIREITIKAGDFSNYFGAHCSMGVSGNVTISITGPCNFHSPVIGALVPNSVIGNVLTYNVIYFGTIIYYSSFNFNILVDTTANIGSQICIQVSISLPQVN